MLIYQEELGRDNSAKSPLGGIIYQSSPALSMLDAITNPIIYCNGSGSTVINQAGHSGDLYNYHWTSYSRGTDGTHNNTNWHNDYLDGYIPLRVKSIYDPCPYLYRIPSNGTFNQFISNEGWTLWSYLGGVSWNLNTLGDSWFLGLGRRYGSASTLAEAGYWGFYRSSTSATSTNGYVFGVCFDRRIIPSWDYIRSSGLSVRCIEGSLR